MPPFHIKKAFINRHTYINFCMSDTSFSNLPPVSLLSTDAGNVLPALVKVPRAGNAKAMDMISAKIAVPASILPTSIALSGVYQLS